MRKKGLTILLISIFLTGCTGRSEQKVASTNHETNSDTSPVQQQSDPLESFNRTMFDFNYHVLDAYVLRPVAVSWRNYVPKPARIGISNVSSNLSEPATMVNYLLQGEGKRALKHFHRFVINSTFGLGGLIDFANHDEGLRKEDRRRFGSVLGYYNVEYGPYVVLPIYGAATPREDIGGVVDGLYPPLSWLVGWPLVIKWVIDGVEMRANLLDSDSLLRNSSDPYVFMRESYFQNKTFQAKDGQVDTVPNPNSLIIEDQLSEIDS